ncbi:MAG: peroxide stress protein YaaA [Cryomorphaceae bacterium]|nr:peroxide stress protein YaaA [Cryomorphaceae bacterium]
MLIVISPAKTLDFQSEPNTESASQPKLLDDAAYLVSKLQKFSSKKLEKLFHVNSSIADENYQRFQEWHLPFHLGNSRQAVLAFKGEVYRALRADNFTDPDFEFAQKHLRILSGLYGYLKPLDLIQPYRLEMGTSWAVTPTKRNLYSFWGSKVTDMINESATDGPLINLASSEYFKVIKTKELKRDIITCHFKELKDGEYKVLMTYAKHARGLMARYIIRNQISDPELLKGFNVQGYTFNEKLSTPSELTFTRDQIPTI